MLFNTTSENSKLSSVVDTSSPSASSAETFSHSFASLKTDYIDPNSANSSHASQTVNTRTILIRPHKSLPDETMVVSPSTVWVPNQASTDVETAYSYDDTETISVIEVTSEQSNIVLQTIYPEETTTQEYTPQVTTTAAETVTTPMWLTASTEVPSSQTIVYYTRDYIFTDTSTTFTTKLPTLTVIPTESTFSQPTDPVVTDTSFYKKWLSGALDAGSDSSSSSSGTNKDTIIGGVIGSVGGLALMLLVIYLLFCNRRKRNLIEHEKSFSHEIGRKMGYDDIGTYIGESQQPIDTNTKLQATAHSTYQATKELPAAPAFYPETGRQLQTNNPFDDEYVVSDPESQATSTTSLHSSEISSSADQDSEETDNSTAYSHATRNSQGFLTELIED
ncbi:unnamed protein product [Kluyveromyces dobzhanskii CBS 2104]|uniref:WGS project CCBQ000000000 data, contig 00104 n=1 Tax=Kluyveromyces dobzhanskii CBS 2104 TaxID=1427455 RepID=A0A0A8L3L4_9SACH|nr:unnamed protein product [Kluyveromyces dobzhanskii CBS 2104]